MAFVVYSNKIMESEYLDPEDEALNAERDHNRSKKGDLERKGPSTKNKDSIKGKNPKVLHKDGSLADMPYNNNPGSGALEGTIGIGT